MALRRFALAKRSGYCHKYSLFSTSSGASSSDSVAATKAHLKSANAVCFDVDSTVIQEEGIDMLAAYKGVGDQVAELTKKYGLLVAHNLMTVTV